jgi:hypothetical protein
MITCVRILIGERRLSLLDSDPMHCIFNKTVGLIDFAYAAGKFEVADSFIKLCNVGMDGSI